MLYSNMPATIQTDRSPTFTQVKMDGAWGNLGASPYNNRLEQSARGRHLLCSGGSIRVGLTAKQLPVPSGPLCFACGPSAVLPAQSSVIRSFWKVSATGDNKIRTG